MADTAKRPNGDIAVVSFNAVSVPELFGQLVAAAASTMFWSGMNPTYPAGLGQFNEHNSDALVQAAIQNYHEIIGDNIIKARQGVQDDIEKMLNKFFDDTP